MSGVRKRTDRRLRCSVCGRFPTVEYDRELETTGVCHGMYEASEVRGRAQLHNLRRAVLRQ